ncbi:la-related protein 1 isoform X3 [Drosophila navojoa]|uniref:la-related protein 1 isoform X3 n=1 Tax=Drosophila navojoa TaxID=7232 RepID=UPI0008465975|nr:la-related protein 1 isoform X3 [Drosophila navojoa]
MSSSSSKDDATASNAGAVTVAAVGVASAAATTSYANVVQNLDSKKAAVATATGPATAAAAATVDNKENQPNLKSLKSWSEETAAAEAAVDESPLVGEKRAAAGGDNTAENSSELDDNNDFLPVLSSHHRRDRKKARKEKPTPREYRDRQQPSAGGSGSGPVQGQGQKSAAGRRLLGGAEADGRKHMARQRVPRGNSPRKNVGAPGAPSTSGSANGNGKTQKERKSDTSPSASLEANNSGNEAKAGDTDAQAAASTAASPAAPQPKRFIAAPPPKVNAWKISTKQVGSPKSGSSPLDKRVLQPKAQQQSKQTGSSNSNSTNNNNNSNKKTQQQQQPQQQQQQQLKQVQQQQGAAAQTAIKTTTITATATTTEAGATVAAAVVAVTTTTTTTTKEAVSTNVDASIADALVSSVVKDKRKVNQKASDFSNVGEWPTLIGGVSGSGKATVNEPKRNATKKQPAAKAATAAGVAAAAGTSSANQPAASVTTAAAAATSSDSNAEPNVAAVAPSSSSSSSQAQNATVSTSQDAKSQREAEQPAGSAAVPATGAFAGAAIHKKIPKHKWRPLQIDLAKSSRPKPIGGRPNRRFSDDAYEQRRPPRAYHERAGPAGARGSEGHAGGGGQAESRPHGGRYAYNARTSAATERVDSWRSSGPSAAVYDGSGVGAEGAAGGAASASAPGVGGLRGPRRFRTPYRGGRQGRGGFTRPGPGRPTNRIPRHLLASGEYANYLPADAAGADSSQSYVLMGTHYFGNVPAAYIEMDAASVKEAIKKQVEYYFSADNLTGDFFLRRKMDPEGYIPVTLIASFHRVLALTTDVALIVTAIKESDKLELFEGYKVRTKTTPTIWPISDITDEADKSQLQLPQSQPQQQQQQQKQQQQQQQQPETVAVEEPVQKKTEKAEIQTEPVKEAVQAEASVATSSLSSTPPPPVILSPAMATRPLNSIPPPPVPRNSNLVPQMLLEKQRPTKAAINSVDAISALTQRVEGVVGQKAAVGAAAELADHLSGLAESVKPKSSSTPEKRTAAKATGAGEGDGVVAALVAEPEGMWKELLLRHPLSAMPKRKN